MGKDIGVYGMQLVRIYILSTLRSQQRRLREAKPGEGRWEGNGGKKGVGRLLVLLQGSPKLVW